MITGIPSSYNKPAASKTLSHPPQSHRTSATLFGHKGQPHANHEHHDHSDCQHDHDHDHGSRKPTTLKSALKSVKSWFSDFVHTFIEDMGHFKFWIHKQLSRLGLVSKPAKPHRHESQKHHHHDHTGPCNH